MGQNSVEIRRLKERQSHLFNYKNAALQGTLVGLAYGLVAMAPEFNPLTILDKVSIGTLAAITSAALTLLLKFPESNRIKTLIQRLSHPSEKIEY